MPMELKDLQDVKLPELNNLTLAEVLAQIEKIRGDLKAARNALPLTTYTGDQRPSATAQGNIRGEERGALEAVLDAADLSPGSVAPLSAQDQGDEDDVFETRLLRARLYLIENIAALGDEAKQLSNDFNDTAVSISVLTRPVILAAYRLLKPAAHANQLIRNALARTIDFYRSLSARKK